MNVENEDSYVMNNTLMFHFRIKCYFYPYYESVISMRERDE